MPTYQRFQEFRFSSPTQPELYAWIQEFWKLSGYQVQPGPPGAVHAQLEHEGYRRNTETAFLPSPQAVVVQVTFRADATAHGKMGGKLRGAFSGIGTGISNATRDTMGGLFESRGTTGGQFAGQAVYSTPTPGYSNPGSGSSTGDAMLDSEWNSLVQSFQDYLVRQRGAHLWDVSADPSAPAAQAPMAPPPPPPPGAPLQYAPPSPPPYSPPVSAPPAYAPPMSSGPAMGVSSSGGSATICPTCHAPVPSGSRFCNACGTKV